jgi:membrane associated rhomboid family serine protease
MLDDRDYMREAEAGEPGWGFRPRFRWSLTVGFLIAYFVVFLTELALGSFSPKYGGFMNQYFALSNNGLSHGYVWQLITYQFMHAGWLHLFFNSWAILTFGQELEYMLGKKRFAALMLSAGMIGGVLQSVVAYFWPLFFSGGVVGASACAFGLVASYAMIFPHRDLTMLIFFVIPVTIQARVLLYVSAGLAALGVVLTFFMSTDHVAHAAHLGGIAMGWAYVKWILKNPALIGTEEIIAEPRRVAPAPRAVENNPEELADDVDAILDKISARGIKSLTTRERAVLEAARKKMTR